MNLMCINIINSNSPWYEAHYHYKDALSEKSWIEWFLKKWGFPVELSEYENTFGLLADLRSLLTRAIDSIIDDGELPQDILAKMNQYFAGSAMHYEVKEKDGYYQLVPVPQKIDWSYVLSEITASFIRLLHEFGAARLKRCENPGCRSVFLDGSKNQARKWCCNTCSSLIKVRRYRARKKA